MFAHGAYTSRAMLSVLALDGASASQTCERVRVTFERVRVTFERVRVTFPSSCRLRIHPSDNHSFFGSQTCSGFV